MTHCTYLAPLGDLGLGDVLDGHGVAVLDALPGVDGAEAALPQLGSHAVRALRRCSELVATWDVTRKITCLLVVRMRM